MKSQLQTAASLLLMVKYDTGVSKVIGFARALEFTVNNGQKTTYVVDSPFPAEIAQGTAPMSVRGSMVLYLPKGVTMESAGLVPYRVNEKGENIAAASRYMSFEVYDRFTRNLIFACEYCKVGTYSVSVQAKGVASVTMQFEGVYMTPGRAF